MGAAGDMLTAALLELLPEEKQKAFFSKFNDHVLEGVAVSCEKVTKCGIEGTHMIVTVNGEEEESVDEHAHHHHDHEEHDHHHHHDHEEHDHHHDHHEHEHHHDHEEHDHDHGHHHHHYSMKDVTNTIRSMDVPENVKEKAIKVYGLIAEAESHAHGKPVEEVHFHEVGSKDAIVDVTAVCYLMNEIGANRVVVSPIHVGSGQVRCAHGVMPVPAPATEYILRGVPTYQGKIKGELCTPTGAALLKSFADDFGPQPLMKVEKTGIGCGKKDFEAANCVRVFLGETVSERSGDSIIELDANVDDMTAEEIGFAMDRLFAAGAREVFTIPVQMKKNRPGTLITVICTEDTKESVVSAFFKHTTTIGIREKKCERYVLSRTAGVIRTEFGDMRTKTSEGYGVKRTKIEFDDAAKIAEATGMSLREVRALPEKND